MEFCVFIQAKGDQYVSEILNVKKRTVGSWRRLERAPTPQQALDIISKTDNLITWEGIYLPIAKRRKKEEMQTRSL